MQMFLITEHIPLDALLPFPKDLQTVLAALLPLQQAIFLLGQVHTTLFASSLPILGKLYWFLTSLFDRQPSWLNKQSREYVFMLDFPFTISENVP